MTVATLRVRGTAGGQLQRAQLSRHCSTGNVQVALSLRAGAGRAPKGECADVDPRVL